MSNCRRYSTQRAVGTKWKRHVSRGQDFGGRALRNTGEVGRSVELRAQTSKEVAAHGEDLDL